MAEYPRLKRQPRAAGRSIPATEAAKNFGRLVDRVRETQATYTIERSGSPVAQIGPVDAVGDSTNTGCTVADLVAALRAGGRLDKAYLKEVEAGVRAANRPTVPDDPWAR